MNRITIKAYTRRGKGGKRISVKEYTRRVGHKGSKSSKSKPGEELENKMNTMGASATTEKPKYAKPTAESIMWDKLARANTMENYNSKEWKHPKSKTKSSPKEAAKKTKVKSSDILSKVEDKVAKFVEKYSGKKYKRQL